MRCLVTGTTGQVGAAVVRRFQELGTILGADRRVIDLANPEHIPERLDALAPDLIINPAAYTAVDRAEDERDLAFAVNATSPGILAAWAAAHGVPIIHFSTDYVFDGSGDRPWREDDRAHPINVYGASKLAGEQAVESAAGAHLIVRTSWVYAAQGKNFLRTIAKLALEREELRIVDDQIGGPTSAGFIADTLFAIVSTNRASIADLFSAAQGRIHLAAGEETSWRNFAEAILTGLRLRNVAVKTRSIIPIASTQYPTKAKRPLNSRLDLSRLLQVYRVEPKPWHLLLESELDQLTKMAHG